MAVEAKRGCGYRKVGGIYLVADGLGMSCCKLPWPLHVCPTCGHGIKQARGWTWVDAPALFSGSKCKDLGKVYLCPLADPKRIGRAGLIWIGEQFYKTPLEFNLEASQLGVSRRIKAVPRGFKVGEHYVMIGHPKAVRHPETDEIGPGIIHVFKPTRIEKIMLESERGTEAEEKAVKAGLTPVFVPDDDPDHQGSVYKKKGKKEDQAELTLE